METVSLGDRRKESIKGIFEIFGIVETKLLVVAIIGLAKFLLHTNTEESYNSVSAGRSNRKYQ